MSVERDYRDVDAAAARSLDLPLVDDRNSTLWAATEATQRDEHVWPALTDALSPAGRKLLWDALRQEVDATPGDPERALMVIEAFWRTMRLRRGPHYQRRVWGERGPDHVDTPGDGHVSIA